MRRLPPLLTTTIVAAATALAASAAAAASATPAAATRRPPCGPAVARTLAAGSRARVYRSGGRTWVCAKGKRPRRAGRGRPTLTRVAGTAVLLVAGEDARSVDARTGRVLRRLATPGLGIQEAVLRRGGAFAVQAAGTIAKADADWPHRQVLATDAAGSSLQADPVGSGIGWDRDTPAGAGAAYLVDRVDRCDARPLATDGGYTIGQRFDQIVMCPAGRPERSRLILDTYVDTGSLDAGPSYTLLAFRAGTAVMRYSQLDRTNSEVDRGLAVLRYDTPAGPVTIGTSGPADFGGGPVERALVDPAGRAVLGIRRAYGVGSPAPGAFVIAVTAAGERQLDGGPGVDPASLTLTGSVATWTRDGVPQAFDLSAA